MAKLIICLGNPGREYSETRHNIAWMFLDHLKFSSDLAWKSKFKAEFANYQHKGENFIFLKPQTFMNLSGESAVLAKKFFKVENSDILAVHDELDIPYGQIMFKSGGGVAGHNGLKSLSQHLGDQSFRRLRLGVSRPKGSQSVSSWVLSQFSSDEKIFLEDYLKGSAKAIESFISLGFEKASNRFSKKSFVPSGD